MSTIVRRQRAAGFGFRCGVVSPQTTQATRALQILGDELVRAMQLCGARNVSEIGPELIVR